MTGGMEGRALEARVPGGSTRLPEEAEVSSFVPVLNLAILPFLEVSRELRLVRQKRSGRPQAGEHLAQVPGVLLLPSAEDEDVVQVREGEVEVEDDVDFLPLVNSINGLTMENLEEYLECDDRRSILYLTSILEELEL